MDFGKVTFEGKIFKLMEEADFTNRQLPSQFVNYHEVTKGETYDAEFSADAVDEDGIGHQVYWMFEFVKGNEPELDSLNWDNPVDVRLVK
ncbi:hypothetical protein [Paenibacillus chitinolyticus]|uniref:hypothetical protein n=1 Tax=Paenibacillus chitinolyticus TaxID=79263 RepID=UPI001C44252F|nr:hypothetical protein [Paenibacillus chitinolyticus]